MLFLKFWLCVFNFHCMVNGFICYEWYLKIWFSISKFLCNVIYLYNNNRINYSNSMFVYMLIEACREARWLEGALVLKETLSSFVPKPLTEFFGDEGSVPLIQLGESNWVSWFPKEQVVTLFCIFHRFFKIFSKCQISPRNSFISLKK